MQLQKVTYITTVLNEESTIEKFLLSLCSQTQLPTEIIIVDAGSIDNTIKIIKKFEKRFIKLHIKFSLLVKKGNRSVGRNTAINKAGEDIIACSDCDYLDKDWLKLITEPFSDSRVDVVAGYYKGLAESDFQKCVIPYILVMEDAVNPRNFLPATRSIAFTKLIWKKVGGFNNRFNHNEDYIFAKNLKKLNAKIVFAQKAIAFWIPRSNVKKTFRMFFIHTLGDIEAGIIRPKVIILIIRYMLAIYILVLGILYKSNGALLLLFFLFCLYLIWAVYKNYRYVRKANGIWLLPFLQILSDAAVFCGVVVGIGSLAYHWIMLKDERSI